MEKGVEIRIDDLSSPEVMALLDEHHEDMLRHSPAESVHALDLVALRQADVTFWSVWIEGSLAGCGALKALDNDRAEIKSMRTSRSHLRSGVASQLLAHIIDESRRRSYASLWLETGSPEAFNSARKLYEKFGFRYCAPFGDYVEDPFSVFMWKAL